MGAWERSWMLTKASFGVISKDREMLLFPILAAISSLLYLAALLVPSFVLDLAHDAGVPGISLLQGVALFLSYFGLAFIATFFNVCVVYTTKTRLGGGDATFFESLGFALSRIHLILGWALVSASVGLLLHAIERAGRRSGVVGRIVLGIVRMLLATAWAVTTIFVTPAMVYRGLGPFDALRDSRQTLSATWGENLVGYFGLGIANFICLLGPLVLTLAGIAVANVVPALGILMIGVGGLGLLAVTVLFNMASTVYRTALYHWAAYRAVPEGFDGSVFQSAFRYG
jgi:hypothetical protein